MSLKKDGEKHNEEFHELAEHVRVGYHVHWNQKWLELNYRVALFIRLQRYSFRERKGLSGR
jgi:hypothetical protein